MKFNVFPNYKIPIEYIFYDEIGQRHIEHVGWISTPNIEALKDDHYRNLELIGEGIDYKRYEN